MGAERKIGQNAVFHGKRHENKILKVQILLSRNFVVIAQAPKICKTSERRQVHKILSRLWLSCSLRSRFPFITRYQGQILAVWILAAKLPNFPIFILLFIFGWISSSCSFQGKKARKIHKNPLQNSPGNLFGKIPLAFLQKPSLDKG